MFSELVKGMGSQTAASSRVLVISAEPSSRGYLTVLSKSLVKQLQHKKGEEVTWLSLYEENFSPVLPSEDIARRFSLDTRVQHYYSLVEKADVLVFIHPLWWGNMPAILKGFLDRVLISTVAFQLKKDKEGTVLTQGLLQYKTALMIITADFPYSRPLSIEKIWEKDIWQFCGLTQAYFRVLTDLVHTTHRRRQLWMQETIEYLLNLL